MIPDLGECRARPAPRVVVGPQNHDDFLQTAGRHYPGGERGRLKWFGVILDVGGLRQATRTLRLRNPYLVAVSWQLKENVGAAEEVLTDLRKAKAIIDKAGYRFSAH
jgi:hypothetical protein